MEQIVRSFASYARLRRIVINATFIYEAVHSPAFSFELDDGLSRYLKSFYLPINLFITFFNVRLTNFFE